MANLKPKPHVETTMISARLQVPTVAKLDNYAKYLNRQRNEVIDLLLNSVIDRDKNYQAWAAAQAVSTIPTANAAD